jgi:hypothetical protein
MSGPIIIAAGGTGGHLFPAEALATEFSARGEAVALFTDARSSGVSPSSNSSTYTSYTSSREAGTHWPRHHIVTFSFFPASKRQPSRRSVTPSAAM